MKKIVLVYLLLIPAFFLKAQNIWTPSNGPFITGGIILSTYIDSSGYIYAGTDDGIYISSDLGNNWTHPSVIRHNINSICSTPNGYIFVLTYDSVFRSTNQGNTWTKVTAGLPPDVYKYDISSSKEGIVYLAAQEGVYKSTDFGETWVNILSSNENYKKIVINESGNIFVMLDKKIVRSTDNGLNWTLLNVPDGHAFYDLSTDITGNLFLTLNIEGVSVTLGYRSTDQGEQWEQFGSSCPLFFYFVAVSPEGLLFLQSELGIYYSADKGVSWLLLSSETGCNSLVFYTNNILFAGSLNGIKKSIDGGLTWHIIGVPGSYAQLASVAADSLGNIFTGSRGDNISVYYFNGLYWLNILALGESGWISGLTIKDNNLIVSANEKIYYSSNLGNTWTLRSNGLGQFDIHDVKFASDGYLYIGTWEGGMYRSVDLGLNWTSCNEGFINPAYMNVDDIAIAPSGNIYIATTDGVYSSSDHGSHWVYLTNEWNQVLSIAVNSDEHIFAARLGYGIFRSTDLGNSWTQVLSITHLIYDILINSEDNIFTAGYEVFRSTDNGNSWIDFSSGTPIYSEVNALASNYDGKLIAANHTYGIYFTVNSVLPVNEDRLNMYDVNLFQNFPNPCNPSTTIPFLLPESENIELKIYDILGNEITTLFNGYKEAGEHKLYFDGSNLSSGVYFYRLRTKEFIQSKKLIITK